mmetsp:Transcript_8801/g.22173  ORF Transcript_8801/g.22173 Transcript_8801/m.22173 type:complete len:239 (-) Transcript_8801:365-1081(-)
MQRRRAGQHFKLIPGPTDLRDPLCGPPRRTQWSTGQNGLLRHKQRTAARTGGGSTPEKTQSTTPAACSRRLSSSPFIPTFCWNSLRMSGSLKTSAIASTPASLMKSCADGMYFSFSLALKSAFSKSSATAPSSAPPCSASASGSGAAPPSPGITSAMALQGSHTSPTSLTSTCTVRSSSHLRIARSSMPAAASLIHCFPPMHDRLQARVICFASSSTRTDDPPRPNTIASNRASTRAL